MDISWFTLIAQVVNFLILVGLLKHFLYDRILEAMDRREQNIQSRLDEAERKQEQAEEEAEKYQREREELERQREEFLSKAREEGEERRKELFQKAREEAEEQRERWRRQLGQEKASFLRELRRRAATEMHATLRQALHDLADASLERQVVRIFAQRLRDLDDERADSIKDSLRSGHEITVQSGFDIAGEDREEIRKALGERFTADVRVTFDTAQDLVCGVELKAGGRKIAWSLESYLDELESNLNRFLEEEEIGEAGSSQGKGNEENADAD